MSNKVNPEPSRRNQGRIVPFESYEDLDDPELVLATRNGNDAAFEALMNRYMPLVAASLHGAVPTAHDAEDLIQEVFLGAYRSIDRLKRPDRIGPWLLKIARNKRTDFFRQRASRPQEVESEPDGIAKGIPSSGSDAATIADHSVLADAVSRFIARESDKYRIILNLRIIDEYTTGEIAQQLGLKESTVRTRLQRGMRKLRKHLDSNKLR